MNSLPLLTHIPGNLHDSDLLVLREFAHYAPYEWRNAFNVLIAAAQDARDADKMEEELDELKAVQKRALEKATTLFGRLEGLLTAWPQQLQTPLSLAELATMRKVLDELVDGLDELTKELEPDEPKKPSVPGVTPAG